MEKEIYKLIDKFLAELEKSEKGILIPFDRSSTKGKYALRLMIKHELADFDKDDIKAIEFVRKSPNGIKILQAEGFEKWINSNNLKAASKEILELRKLDLDVKNAERIYKSYWWTFGIAVLGVLLALTSLFLQLKK